MSIDIVLFALVAAFLVHRLRSILGEKHGDERERPNPFSPISEEDNIKELAVDDSQTMSLDTAMNSNMHEVEHNVEKLDIEQVLKDGLVKSDEKLEQSLLEIAAADASFDVYNFATGAKMAFELIVEAYAKGDLDSLKPLLSQKLYDDFEKNILQRESKGIELELELHEIKSMQIIDAKLAGTMIYITVDFDVEETIVTKNEKGEIVKSKSKHHKEMHDIWTFARDVRSTDPTWLLIETRAA